MTTISIRIAEARTRTNERVVTQALPEASVWSRTMAWFRSAWCMMNGGHYKVLHTEPDRLALRCVACGHMSPGWEVGSPRVARRTPADPERLRVRRPIAA
jgi:hypothetical protein